MTTTRKNQIRALLKGIETGDPESVAVVNPNKYIQHNPQTHEGGEGLAALFKRIAKSSPRVNIVRAFADGEFVFAHTEYDFATRKIGFEVFRFEDDLVVEHWDNIQERKGPNAAGHTMVDGSTEVADLDRTEANRELVTRFVSSVFIDRAEELGGYLDPSFVDYAPEVELADKVKGVKYERLHRVLAEGDFVLVACEGEDSGGVRTAFYDLFRVAGDKIAEHWETIEAIPPRSEWKNDNGKF